MKPSTLASGVRSSWETMFTSSVFIRSLSRSSSFCASSSLRPCSSRSAIELNARVSSPTSPGPSLGSRSESSPAASRFAPDAAARIGRPTERASTIPKRVISAVDARTATAPTSTARSVRPPASPAASAASVFSAARNSGRAAGSRRSAPCRSAPGWSPGRGPGSSRSSGISGATKSLTYARICVRQHLRPRPLVGVVGDARDCSRRGATAAPGVRCSYGSSELVRPVTVKPRKPVSTSETSFSSWSDATVTSFERASRSVASRCAETARMSAVNAAPTSTASTALASHIRRASVMRAAPRRRR